MCKGDVKCKACAAAIKGTKMAKSRKSSKSLVQDGLYITGGVVAGGYAVPQLVNMIDPTGKFDPKLVQGAAAAGGFFGAMNTKGTTSKILLGVGIGAAANLLGDELSGADIQMSFIGEIAKAQGKLQAYPNLAAWVQKFQARPAYRRAVERGGEYAFAK